MANVTVNIDSKIYHISCEEHQEEHINNLAKKLDMFIKQLRNEFGNLHHQQLAIMAAMLNLDEVEHLQKELTIAKKENKELINSIINSANTIKNITEKLEAS